jgi:hypothetical protein
MPTNLPNLKNRNRIVFLFKDKIQVGQAKACDQQNKSTTWTACLWVFVSLHPRWMLVQSAGKVIGKQLGYWSTLRGGGVISVEGAWWETTIDSENFHGEHDLQTKKLECLSGIDEDCGVKNWAESSLWVRLNWLFKSFYSILYILIDLLGCVSFLLKVLNFFSIARRT